MKIKTKEGRECGCVSEAHKERERLLQMCPEHQREHDLCHRVSAEERRLAREALCS